MVRAAFAVGSSLDQWLLEVDGLCLRFLDTEFGTLAAAEPDRFSPEDFHSEGLSPAVFFKEIVLGDLERELGRTVLTETLARNAKWGRDEKYRG